jgi:hypothetical protein
MALNQLINSIYGACLLLGGTFNILAVTKQNGIPHAIYYASSTTMSVAETNINRYENVVLVALSSKLNDIEIRHLSDISVIVGSKKYEDSIEQIVKNIAY